MANEYSVTYSARSLNESEWTSLPSLAISHYLWEQVEDPYRPRTEVRLYFTDEAIHVRFRVQEAEPVAVHSEPNSPVYQDSCVEFFLQPHPERDPRYLNFEFNAAGTMLLGIGADRTDRDRSPGLQPALFDAKADKGLIDELGERYWQLTFRIPFAVLADWFPGFAPASRMEMRGNFYKCGDLTSRPHYAAWNDIPEVVPDFHRSQYFGKLIFTR